MAECTSGDRVTLESGVDRRGVEVRRVAGNVDQQRTPGRSARGRPRNPEIDARVYASTRKLLVALGYNALSFEAVARDVGVTRPTLYLRWPTKAHLVYETVFPQRGDGIPNTGDFAADLRGFIKRMAVTFSDPVFRSAFPGLIADFHSSPELERELITENWAATRKAFSERLTEAAAAGQIAESPRGDDLLDIIIGSLFQRIIVVQEPTVGFIDTLVDTILYSSAPLAARRRSRPS
jgi:AcrR family transcriptional regulator